MSSAVPSEPKHLPVLDGFRGLAILLVVLSHFLEVGSVVTEETWWGRLLLGGFVGVDMFFVLSGFLITGILLDSGMGSARSFGVFYARRALRIFPLYYAALALVFLCGPEVNDSPWWHWLYASNLGATWKDHWLENPAGFDLGHFWSLAVEEQFYLLWPFLVAFASRRTLAWICLACMVIAPAVHFALHFSGNEVGAYVFTPVRLNTLAAGAWLAIAFRNPPRWESVRRMAKPTVIASGALAIAGLIWPSQISLIPFAPFLWGSALVISISSPGPWQRLLRTAPLLLLGKLSYGLYVIHYLFHPWMKGTLYDQWISAWTGGNAILSLILYVVVAFLLSLGAAWLSWQVLEKPCLSLKRYFRYQCTDSKTPPPSSLPPS